MFKQLKDIVGVSVNKAGLSSEFRAIGVINEYKKAVRDVIGDEAAQYLVPRSYKNGVLKVEARGASWASVLHMRRVEIIRRIDLVKKLDIRIVDQSTSNLGEFR